MANIDITNIDLGKVVIPDDSTVYADEALTVGGAGTTLPGTILARSSVTGKLVPFAVGGSNGSGTPVAVLPSPAVAAGAGDVQIRALVRGKVNQRRLVIAADGDADNITKAQHDLLRSLGIVPVDVDSLGQYDNPQS